MDKIIVFGKVIFKDLGTSYRYAHNVHTVVFHAKSEIPCDRDIITLVDNVDLSGHTHLQVCHFGGTVKHISPFRKEVTVNTD